jgi:type I restriction enzyme R subunit
MKAPLSQAISQHLRNQQEDGIRGLYVYAQLLLGLATHQAAYGTNASPEKFWAQWEEKFEASSEEQAYRHALHTLRNTHLTAAQKDELFAERFRYVRYYFEAMEKGDLQTTRQDEYLYSLCRPERLLDLTHNYILFEDGEKKIARYQQYFAIRKTMQRVRTLEHGKRRGGVIWHTQGSGKSLTMVMLAQAIAQEKSILNPKIILVTDRVDLDSQLTKTFGKCKKPVLNATTGQRLIELLESKSDAVVTTIINKFEAAVNKATHPFTSPDIFVLIDEGHRTQYGTFNVKMQKVLPNACFLAFTGTPLLKKEKSTAGKFGGIIDKYTVDKAVKDGAVVPILYEGRHAVQEVNTKAIDRYFDMVSEPLTPYQRADLKKKFSRADQLNTTEQKIHNTAWDITTHYLANWGKDKTGTHSGFKGMVVCPNKLTAIRYKEVFDQIGRISTDVIISAPDEREGTDEAYGESTDQVLRFWKKMMDKHGKKYEENTINQFKHGDTPELLIVVDKLLTGFDAPRAVVLYVCRSLKEHTLLQAIARVNRVSEGKDYGYIIDYYGILGELDQALTTYTSLEDFDEEDLAGTLTDVREELKKLPQRHSELVDIFKTIPNKLDEEAYAALLGDEAIRSQFYDKLSAFARALKIALASLEYENNTPEKEKQLHKDHLLFFSKLRVAVR